MFIHRCCALASCHDERLEKPCKTKNNFYPTKFPTFGKTDCYQGSSTDNYFAIPVCKGLMSLKPSNWQVRSLFIE